VYLALSHPHADHVGGARSVVGPASVDTLWDTGFPGTSPAYRDALDSSLAHRVAWRRMLAGDSTVFDGVLVRALAPDAAWLAAQENPNEASLVLQVQYGAVRLLLTGDAEAGEEHWLLSRHPRGLLASDVLKVGHHGSATSTTPAFLRAVAPQVAVISVGADNDYGHPSPEVLRSLDAAGVRVLRTDEEGPIMLSTDGTTITVTAEDSRWHFSGRSPRR
jgi:competence protein ComEC